MAPSRYCSRMRVIGFVAITMAIGACEVAEPVGSAAEAITDTPTLVFHRRVAEPAPGSDERPLHSLAWRLPNGQIEPIDLPSPALHAVALDRVLYWVDGDHRLHRLEGDADELVADGVFARPIASGERVFFVEGGAGEAQTIHWRDADGDGGGLATGLYQLGALALAPDESALLGVGSVDGGVAGLWVVPLGDDEARCLSNCELRVGRPWGDAFVAPPAAADGLTFDGDEVRWDTPAGPVSRTWRRP